MWNMFLILIINIKLLYIYKCIKEFSNYNLSILLDDIMHLYVLILEIKIKGVFSYGSKFLFLRKKGRDKFLLRNVSEELITLKRRR